jgi:hypothetical protein
MIPSSRATPQGAGKVVGVVTGLIMAVASALIPSIDPSSVGSVEVQLVGVTGPELSEELTVAEGETLLAQLVIAPEGPRTGYSRDAFRHWVDADGDGCDTREEVLLEESLIPASQGSGCVIETGEWFSPYDATTFVAPGGLDIDHMVPLGEAWDSGAAGWDAVRRQDYANDFDHSEALIAVSASSNRSKSDRDPGEWKPENRDYWCQYAFSWMTVKTAWALSADAAEVQALQEMIATCSSASAGDV